MDLKKPTQKTKTKDEQLLERMDKAIELLQRIAEQTEHLARPGFDVSRVIR